MAPNQALEAQMIPNRSQITPNQALEGQIIPNRALTGSTNGSNQIKRCRPKWLKIKPWSLKKLKI